VPQGSRGSNPGAGEPPCPVTHTLTVIGGKWKPVILFLVSKGASRFGILHRGIVGISRQMLTQQLRELESAGVLSRTVFAEVPPRVEYGLTSHGRSLLPVIRAMKTWGEAHLDGRHSLPPQVPRARSRRAGKER